ncbi:hypothetical protein UF64_14290 [Thalassospira sp. HJ]|nr:hypothetical protein UF64_14290 [Thalassospira sp. HJ]
MWGCNTEHIWRMAIGDLGGAKNIDAILLRDLDCVKKRKSCCDLSVSFFVFDAKSLDSIL